jgi:hypothetical protein
LISFNAAMVRSFLSVFLLLASASAFVNRPPVAFQASSWTGKLAMFSADDKESAKTDFVAAPLALESDATAAATPAAGESTSEADASKSYVRNLNTGEVMEVKWSDPAMQAHTQYVLTYALGRIS